MISLFKLHWRSLVLVLAPIVFLPVALLWRSDTQDIAYCTYIILIMAVYWASEALDIATTALIPLFAFPLLMVLPATVVASAYIQDITFLFLGGLIIGVLIEETRLHRRIALIVLKAAGSQPKWLLAGVMLVTAFLSMWISNTATTSMMVPVVMALMIESIRAQRLHNQDIRGLNDNGYQVEPDKLNKEWQLTTIFKPNYIQEEPIKVEISKDNLSQSELQMVKGMLLAVCYAASLGGTATLTGTPPNLVMAGFLTQSYGDDHSVTFATWMIYNVPGLLINLIFAWIWLQIMFFEWRYNFTRQKKQVNPRMTEFISKEIAALGPVRFEEYSVLYCFIVLLLLWLTRSYTWGAWFTKDGVYYVSDTTCVMVVVFITFAWPKVFPELRKASPALLRFEAVRQRVPWDVIILLGGGFAVGKAAKVSGLSTLIGSQLSTLNVSNSSLCIISVIIMTYTTEFTSNTATSNILIPIVIALANKRCINPLYLTMPTTEAASFAFMLPVATPPNAIVFSTGILKVRDMMLSGSVMNLFCMLEVLLSIHTWGAELFVLQNFPDWARTANTTNCFLS